MVILMKVVVPVLVLVGWCFEPSQPQRITSGLIVLVKKAVVMV